MSDDCERRYVDDMAEAAARIAELEADAVDLAGSMRRFAERAVMAEAERDNLALKLSLALKRANNAEAERYNAEAERYRLRERLAALMIRHSIATGHGDTADDLLGELDGHLSRGEALAYRSTPHGPAKKPIR